MKHSNAEKLTAILVLTTARESMSGSAYSYLAVKRTLELALHMHENGVDMSVVKELTYPKVVA